jgi:hypothetical protein
MKENDKAIPNQTEGCFQSIGLFLQIVNFGTRQTGLRMN